MGGRRRWAAAAVLATSVGLLWGGPPVLDLLRRVSAGGGGAVPVCSYRARTGRPCLGCGGTTALAHTARGDFRGALAANALGAAVGAVAWMTALGALLAALTARDVFLKGALVLAVVVLPLAFVGRAVHWWISLPASATDSRAASTS